MYPETANRQLEDIDALYREDKSMILVFRNKDAIQVQRPQRFIDADQERIEMVHGRGLRRDVGEDRED